MHPWPSKAMVADVERRLEAGEAVERIAESYQPQSREFGPPYWPFVVAERLRRDKIEAEEAALAERLRKQNMKEWVAGYQVMASTRKCIGTAGTVEEAIHLRTEAERIGFYPLLLIRRAIHVQIKADGKTQRGPSRFERMIEAPSGRKWTRWSHRNVQKMFERAAEKRS